MANIEYLKIANDKSGKALTAFAASVIAKYNVVAGELHAAACMTLFHVAEYGECHALNLFYKGLRVNDQTALRVWLGNNATYGEKDNLRPWLKYTVADGFKVVKGTQDYRKDKFTLNDSVELVINDKANLIAVKPFYEKNVRDRDAITLEALIEILHSAASRVTKRAENEAIKLPAAIIKLTTEITATTEFQLEKIHNAEADKKAPAAKAPVVNAANDTAAQQ